MTTHRASRTAVGRAIAAALLALAAGCASQSKEAEEAARNTFACSFDGQRIVIRFDGDEARMLMPSGDRVTLYQIPSASGVRYTNGLLELRGRGAELALVRDGISTPLDGCQPYAPPS